MDKISETHSKIQNSLDLLLRWIETKSFAGYDPYDGLNSKKLKKIFNNRFSRIFFTQFFKRFPINLRPFLGIDMERNPKGMGLFLSGYLKIYDFRKEGKYINKSIEIMEWLKINSSKGYSGYCWGYNFPWQSYSDFLKQGEPTIVNTSFISNAILDFYAITKNKEWLKIARSSCNFILTDLNITGRPEGICFSYTPFDKNLCHNANLLGAELLSRVYLITGEETLLERAKKAFDFTLHHQNPDGSWDYSIDPQTGKERKQIDFHQGFVLDSIFSFIKYSKPSDDRYMKSLLKGAEFYKNEQFLQDGRCKYRWPRLWPVDIHNQAQGIITFSKLSEMKPEYLEFAKTIANRTIENMQDSSGYFYYQKHRFFTNKIPYMRWSQAWMMLALASLLEAMKNEEE